MIPVINAFFIAKPSKYNHGFNSSLVSLSELTPSAHFLYFVGHEKAEKTRIPQAQVDTVEVSGSQELKAKSCLSDRTEWDYRITWVSLP